MAGMNNARPTSFSSSVLIADTVQTSGGSNDTVPAMTTAVNVSSGLTVPVSASVEVQSSNGAFLFPRLTSAQLAAAAFTPSLGMIARDVTMHGWVQSQDIVTMPFASNFTPLSIFTASGTLTAAQFIAGYAVPITLIASPGLSGIIVIRSFYLELVWTALNTQYTLGGAVSLQYGNAIHAGGILATATIAAADINAAVASTLFTAAPVVPGEASLRATFVNLGIFLSNATQAFATGNSPIKYYIEYSIMPV